MPKKITQDEIIKRAIAVHGDRYGYELVMYKTMRQPVSIICKHHGIFKQQPWAHIQGQGCPRCGMKHRVRHNKSMRLSTREFIQKAAEVHDNKYDYSLTKYKNATTPITITCPEHGSFFQRPTDHLHRKTGCPICASIYKTRGSGVGCYTHGLFKSNPELCSLPGTIYFVELTRGDETFLKVGITKRKTNERMWGNGLGYSYTVLAELHNPLYECFTLEQKILKKYVDYKFTIDTVFTGRTELFKPEAKEKILHEFEESKKG